MRFSCAVFDLDGTLLDSSPMWEHLGERYLDSIGVQPRGGLSDRLRRLSSRQGALLLKEEYSLPYTPEEIEKQITAMTECFYRLECPLKEGARELIEQLYSAGMTLAIATLCGREPAAAALERLGILRYFSGIADCAEHGDKSSPRIFLAAAELAGGVPENTIVFEDSLHAVLTAKAAGFVTAAVSDISEPEQQRLSSEADLYEHSLTGYIGRFNS